MSLEEQLERARNDESYRQIFVNQVPLEWASKYIHNVIYEPKQEYTNLAIGEMQSYMSCEARPLFKITSNLFFYCSFRKSNIHIYPLSFTDPLTSTINRFLSCLIDHEGFHAKQAYSNPLNFKDDNRKQTEIDAYLNQIRTSYMRGLDDNFRAELIRKIGRWMNS